MKKIKLLGISCFIAAYSFTQQQVQFTQYNDNMMYYNPAYTGSHGYASISGLHRQQWVGFDGAPSSHSISMHSPIVYESLGLGLGVLYDKVGPITNTNFQGTFSYAFKLGQNNKNRKLRFGLSGGATFLSADFESLTQLDSNDPMSQGSYNNVSPEFGAGVYYSSENFYAGLSVPTIIESDINEIGRVPNQRHYYLSLGGYLKLNRQFKLRPSLLFKVTENAPFAADGSLALVIYDKFWIGGNYRFKESAGVLFQYQISEKFKIGYSADFSTSKLVSHNFGTHELLWVYGLSFSNKKVISPRFF